jgi:hypothetical protein
MTLGAVRAVTIVCSDLDAVTGTYSTCLGYRVVERSRVAPALAAAWGAPAVADCRLAVLAPASGADTYIRFVEIPGAAAYAPCSAWGWHSLELTVSDCDAATARLAQGPFRILGDPKDLSFADGALRASQLQGPCGEVLYLTEVRRPVPGYELPVARTLIDRVFIVVLHGASAQSGLRWYSRTFGNAASETMDVPIEFMAALHGLDPSYPYRIGTLTLAPGFYFELDDTPAHVGARPRPAGSLPPGIAMVTCMGRQAQQTPSRAMEPVPGGPVYAAARTVSRSEGPFGEWLELIGPKGPRGPDRC